MHVSDGEASELLYPHARDAPMSFSLSSTTAAAVGGGGGGDVGGGNEGLGLGGVAAAGG